MILLFFCCAAGALVFLAIGNTEPLMRILGGVILGFIVWLAISFIMLMSSAFGCNSLDSDDMCIDYGNGEVRARG